MKFWGKFSKSIFKFAAQPRIKQLRPKLIESVLLNSTLVLDPEMITEIRSYLLSQQTPQGGFADRGGKCDLYYTLFGWYIAEAFAVKEAIEPLKKYVVKTVSDNNLTGVYRYCGAILYAKLIGPDATTEKLRLQIVKDLTYSDSSQPGYSSFLGMLALYYMEDFYNIQRIINQHKRISSSNDLPCPVVAANAVMLGIGGTPQSEAIRVLKSFYRGKGGFAALHQAPAEDLLSTAVALYALHFLNDDIRLIKPECLTFVDDLYDNGGFRATHFDTLTDVEYTFYGLLALGSLS